jgi:hypothetical protein
LHDVYAYGHWPLTLGLAAAGVGLEGAILEGGQPTLTSGTRWLLCGGVVLSLGALTADPERGRWIAARRPALARDRVPLVLAAGLGGGLSPAAVLAGVTVVLVGEAVAGLVKQRRGTLTTGAPEEGP